MLRCNSFVRVAAGAVTAQPSTLHVAHLTRSFNRLALAAKLVPVTGISTDIARSFATKTATRAKPKAKTVVKKKTPTRAKAKSTKPVAKKKTPVRAKAKKVVKKKKKVVPKPRKRVPTEKQKAAAVATKARSELTKLKETALLSTAPKRTAENAWTCYTSDKMSEKLKGRGGNAIADAMKTVAADFRALSGAEREHYNHIANQNKAANEKLYQQWVKSYTPDQIRLANKARALLKRRVASGASKRAIKGLEKIKDERAVKRPATGYLVFSQERRSTGDFKDIPLVETSKLVTAEWNELPSAEKKKYTDLQAANIARYQREYQATYGHPYPGATKPAAKA